MENSSYALVLTGSVLPGFAPEAVWPALAGYFRMEQDKLAGQLLARAPLTIKQSDDLGKLQTLQAGIAAAGAEAEICALDGRPGLFVLLDNAPRGPVPRVLVEERVQHGLWPATLPVAEVGTSAWKPYREFDAAFASPPAPPAPPVEEPYHAGDVPATIVRVQSAPEPRSSEPTVLPAGAAVHAGFWRRCAAYVIDYAINFAIAFAVGAAAGFARPGAGPASSEPVGVLVGLVIGWLYFALQESSATQATLGKRALGIKVTDDYGRRIGFGRATGRFFGKLLSSLILAVGYMLAGWTERKQALHDMLAGTLVVFRGVQPGQPLPGVRPPMPWYGWLLNILMIVLLVLAAAGSWLYAVQMAGSAVTQGGAGF